MGAVSALIVSPCVSAPLAGALVCYRPYECADGWVSLGALEPKFWQAWCRGVGREELIGEQFQPPGSPAHEQVSEIFRSRTRAEWEAFAATLLPAAADMESAALAALGRNQRILPQMRTD